MTKRELRDFKRWERYFLGNIGNPIHRRKVLKDAFGVVDSLADNLKTTEG